MTLSIAYNNTLITTDNKTSIDRFYIREKYLKNTLLPLLYRFEGKKFDKYTDLINLALGDGNICEEYLKETYNINCDYAYMGFSKGNYPEFIKGALSVFREVVQDYERGDKSEASLRRIINSRMFQNNIAHIATILGPITLWLKDDAEFYISKLIDEFESYFETIQFIKMIISILAILISVRVSWAFSKPTKIRFLLLLKLLPDIAIYENSILRKLIEQRSGKKEVN